MNKKILIRAIFILLILVLSMSCFFAGYFLSPKEVSLEGKSIHLVNANIHRTIPLVAVNTAGRGVIINLTVEIGQGEGRALVNLNNILADYDTQQSARNAMAVASDYLGQDLSYTDVIFSIDSYSGIISGPSAGAAMTAALIATLKGIDIKEHILLSGTIERDGSIGPVGSLIEKAKAAKAYGATLFLVPAGQSQVVSKLKETCYVKDNQKICEKRWMNQNSSLSAEAGIAVAEVQNIGEVMSYLSG